jgi:hypothetical protein
MPTESMSFLMNDILLISFCQVLGYRQYFDPLVMSRANELITLLKFPSIASAVLDRPLFTDDSDSFYMEDKNSSLPFLLMPTNEYEPSEKLHPFALTG